MTYQELIDFNKGRNICQMAFVCRDIQAAMQNWIDVMNVGPWMVLSFDNETVTDLKVDGKTIVEPFKWVVALADMGNMQIELMQQVYGPLPFNDFIEKHGEGFHHFKEKLTVKEIDNLTKELEKKEIIVAEGGWFLKDDVHEVYATYDRLHMHLEVGNAASLQIPEDKVYYYPAKE